MRESSAVSTAKGAVSVLEKLWDLFFHRISMRLLHFRAAIVRSAVDRDAASNVSTMFF
jgi:hypothetical protein